MLRVLGVKLSKAQSDALHESSDADNDGVVTLAEVRSTVSEEQGLERPRSRHSPSTTRTTCRTTRTSCPRTTHDSQPATHDQQLTTTQFRASMTKAAKAKAALEEKEAAAAAKVRRYLYITVQYVVLPTTVSKAILL